MRRELDHDLSGILYSVPEARARHARAVFVRVYLPLIAGGVLLAGLMLAANWGAGGNLSLLADVSVAFLVFLAMLAGWVVFLAAVLLALLAARATDRLPLYSGRVRRTVAQISFRLRKLSDTMVGVVHLSIRLWNDTERVLGDAASTVRRTFRQIFSRG